MTSVFIASEGEFRVYIFTGESGTNEEVMLHVYGEDYVSGPIILGKVSFIIKTSFNKVTRKRK